ncbi:MAG TPA: peptidyl-prolyl cis-trans isomerase [Thermoanaerobaculia bacterium]|nr:peptidyl-prolyl cis-trans isomerase [Thermoanaerobaculia bacterium]
MKRVIAIVALILAGAAARAEVVEAVVARVGDRIITRSQYVARLADGLREIQRNSPPAQAAERGKQFRDALFNEMLSELLIKDRADRLGLTVTAQELDDAIARLMEQYAIETEEAFEESLRSSGLTRSEMELRLRDTLLTNKVFGRELRSRGEISDRELRQRYEAEKETYRLPERARLRELVVVVPPGADLATRVRARAEAEEAVTRARGGESFQALVTEYSDSPSKENGGDIGTVGKGELLAALDRVVFDTPAGETTGPIETQAGFHVLLVEARLPSEIPSFDQIKETLRRDAGEDAFQRDYRTYIERLRNEAYVQVFEENLPGA